VRIQSQLPEMRKQLADQLKVTRFKLEEMGGAPPRTDDEMRSAATTAMLKIGAVLDNAISGQYRDQIFAKQANLRLIARIRAGPHADFAAAVAETKPTDAWSVEELKILIASMRGREVPGFLSFQIFELLIRQAIFDWVEPMQVMLESVKTIVDEVCESAILHSATGAHKGLVSTVTAVALDVISARVALTQSELIPGCGLCGREWVPVAPHLPCHPRGCCSALLSFR
jgi:hypothetical protein